MRGVDFQAEGDQSLTVRRRRTPGAAILPLLALAGWICLIGYLGPGALYGMIVLGVGAGCLPLLVPRLLRALRRSQVKLLRQGPAMLLEGEPLEAGRVETRVLSGWFTHEPKGYSLSLWVVFTDGASRDVELGRFRGLLEVSTAAGTIEAFLGSAAIKSKPASTVR